MTEKPQRRWYSCSTRELLLVTVVVAAVLGWWVDRRSLVDVAKKGDRERERHAWNAEALRGIVEATGGSADIMLSGIHAKIPIHGGGMADSWQFFDAESPTTVPEPNMPPRIELP